MTEYLSILILLFNDYFSSEDVTVTVLQRAHSPGAQADVPAAPVAWDPTMTVLFVLLGALVCCTCGVVVVVFVVKKIKSGKGKTKGCVSFFLQTFRISLTNIAQTIYLFPYAFFSVRFSFFMMMK